MTRKKPSTEAKAEEFDKYLKQYIEQKPVSKETFNEYSKAAYINGFLDGIDILTGKNVDVYYHGMLAARELLTGEKPVIHFR